MNTLTGNRIIPTYLEFHASSRPNVTALTTETNTGVRQGFTWSELDALVNQASHWILAQGLGRGDSIVLHVPNSLEFFLLWLAAGKTGAVAVPVDPASTAAELRYIIEHSDARLVVTEERKANVAHAACEGCGKVRRVVAVSLTTSIEASDFGRELATQSSTRPVTEVGPLDVAGMLYTSGTTGRPKGVMLTHAAYLYGAEVFARATRLGPADHHLIPLPLHHAAAQCHAMTPSLAAGAATTIVERFSASRFLEQAARSNATRAALFAAPLRMLLRHYADSGARTPLDLVTFAQNLTAEEMREWETKFGIPLMQLWGMTETVGLPLMVPLNGPRDNMCMGLPVAGYEVRIVDGRGNEVSDGVPGEIVVRDERGQFHFLGRFKEMIKRAGENISPLEVEDVLKAHGAVLDAAVVGVPDPLHDEHVLAFVVFREGCSATADELKVWCAQTLSAFKIPEGFEICREFPRTSVGKVQRQILRTSWLDRLDAGP